MHPQNTQSLLQVTNHKGNHMKIVCLSDTHGQHAKINQDVFIGVDLILYAGDWTASTTHYRKNTENFLEWANSITPKDGLFAFIAGNHDLMPAKHFEEFERLAESYANLVYLQDEYFVYNGLMIYGSPWSNKFYDWAFMGSEDELEEYWDKIPEDTDILLTHGPAYSILDRVNNAYSKDPNVGSKTLQNKLLELTNLKLHLSGHIHEARGHHYSTTGCLHVNASILDETYRIIREPVVLEFTDGTLEVVSR